MLNAGLRIGEVCALKWYDVEGGVVDVHGAMHSDGSLVSTKTPAGMRKVPISDVHENQGAVAISAMNDPQEEQRSRCRGRMTEPRLSLSFTDCCFSARRRPKLQAFDLRLFCSYLIIPY